MQFQMFHIKQFQISHIIQSQYKCNSPKFGLKTLSYFAANSIYAVPRYSIIYNLNIYYSAHSIHIKKSNTYIAIQIFHTKQTVSICSYHTLPNIAYNSVQNMHIIQSQIAILFCPKYPWLYSLKYSNISAQNMVFVSPKYPYNSAPNIHIIQS